MEPGFYSTNLLFLGKTYWRLGDKEKAKEWLEKTVAFDGPCAGDVEDIQVQPGVHWTCVHVCECAWCVYCMSKPEVNRHCISAAAHLDRI